MTTTETGAPKGVDSHRLARDAFFGFAFGFLILHPVSMLVFWWLDPCFAKGMPDVGENAILGTALYTFHPSMFPMGVVYGLLCSFIAVVNGYQRRTIKNQRDILVEQLARNERYRMELQEQADLLRTQNERLTALERANRRHTQFMVHDLKTHLGCILGFADLLLDQKNESRKKDPTRALERIRRQAHQMKGEIDDLLDLARIQQAAAIRGEEIVVPQLLNQAASDFSLPEHENRITITENGRLGHMLRGDPRLLRRVLTNLISNALRHNPAGTNVVLDVEKRPDRGDVLFTCTDDGTGIPQELRSSIFEDFRTGDTGALGHSGLGLAFCKAAIEAHGGRIWYENRDKGTRFCFTIPIEKESSDEHGNNEKKARVGR